MPETGPSDAAEGINPHDIPACTTQPIPSSFCCCGIAPSQLPGATWLPYPTVYLCSWLFQPKWRFALVFAKLHPAYLQAIPLITELSWALILSSLASLAFSRNSNKGALHSFIHFINENME